MLADMPASQSLVRPAVGVGNRCAAVAIDGAAVLAVALALFAALGSFWTPLAIFSLCYYTGATLFLGTTPALRRAKGNIGKLAAGRCPAREVRPEGSTRTISSSWDVAVPPPKT